MATPRESAFHTISGLFRPGRKAAAVGEKPVLCLTKVTKAFGGRKVLDELDLAVPKGQSLVVLGLSGTGKSVLLKHIIGLLRPDSGTVEICGQNLWKISGPKRDQLRKKFGMSFQEGALFDSMSVAENISFGLRRHTKMKEPEIKARVAECLEMVRLPGIEEKRPSDLSGGMRRRVGFARSIALKPEILLFDEPTTGLDSITSDVLAKVIVEMKKRLNPTMVTITHDLKVAFEIADRVAVLSNGKIHHDMPPAEFEKSDDPEVQAFVRGDSTLEKAEVAS